MKNATAAVKVGLTFIVVAAAGYWAFTMLAKGKWLARAKPYTVHAYFRDATLLVEKSRVQVAGVNVGHIIRTELAVDPPRPELLQSKRFAKVLIGIDPAVTLYENAIISKTSASLLGDFYLEIFPGTRTWVDAQGVTHESAVIADGGEIRRVGELTTTSQVMEQMSSILPVVQGLAEDLRTFTRGPLTEITTSLGQGIEENRQVVTHILANLEQITEEIRSVTGTAQRDVTQIADDIKAITASVRSFVGTAEGTDQVRSNLHQELGQLSQAVDKLNATLANIESVSGGLAHGEGTVGRLLKDDKLIDDVESVVEDTGKLIKSVTQLQTIVGLRTEYNFQSGGIKTYLSIELHPRPDKYYIIELIDDPRGRRSVSTVITRTDDPTRPPLSRSEVVEISDAFRFSFQFAKRVSNLIFRFGIKESTGGVGVDLTLFNRRLWLINDFFDFQANTYPRWKVLAGIEFWQHLYIVGGIDDMLNNRLPDGSGGGRDYFLGGQIRFTDEDLKNLLLFGFGDTVFNSAASR